MIDGLFAAMDPDHDRAIPQLASDMADQAASTLGSGREPFDCLRDLRISGGSGCLASSRSN